MKHSTISCLFLLSFSCLLFFSCNQEKKVPITGTWKISKMKIQSYEQQQAMSEKQITMLQDSISKNNSDTAKLNKFQKQLTMVEKRVNDFKANQDSVMKNNRWEFKSNGDFTATETDGAKTGIWSLDEDKMILFTIINKQTASVHIDLAKDTLTLQFDSLNYMKFTRVQ